MYINSGFDEIMPPHRIRAVVGLHAISEFKNRDDNTIDDSFEKAYEIEFRNIVVHPNYECKRPDNDIGNIKNSIYRLNMIYFQQYLFSFRFHCFPIFFFFVV